MDLKTIFAGLNGKDFFVDDLYNEVGRVGGEYSRYLRNDCTSDDLVRAMRENGWLIDIDRNNIRVQLEPANSP